jgi:catechol 2,3-dioxygenase-like lactoylglutathione lyase family enzyme
VFSPRRLIKDKSPMPMKFLGLSHIALRVRDLAKARAFYVDTLGFQVITESDHLVLTQARGLVLGLIGNSQNTPADDTFNPFRIGLDHIALSVANHAALEKLKVALDSAGIRNNGIERDATAKVDYISFYDPDGIAWEFYVMPLPVRIILGLANVFGIKLPKQNL